jgi:2-polyprenyl-6-methoxyphenol hydroxylase-like FAD-dependent oxidoreductase
MLGDAAHPMTPFLGQGACVAIEDAMVLGRAFAAASTFREAFNIYESTRKERASSIQLASRQQADELQGATMRDRIPERMPMTAACIYITLSQYHSRRRTSGYQKGRLTWDLPGTPTEPHLRSDAGHVWYT